MSVSEKLIINSGDTATSGTRRAQAPYGEFVDHGGERFYAIRNVDRMPPFFVSMISSSDNWMFLSSTGGLTAGRVSPDNAIFPYIPVDKIHESSPHTGSKTVLRLRTGSVLAVWEPFADDHHGRYRIRQNMYKNVLGNRVMFEQINLNLDLVFRYTWSASDRFGFVRDCELINNSNVPVQIEMLDGVQNVMPARVSRDLQASTSNLVDAYKWNELDQSTGLALFTLYSRITDKALPCESLTANTVFCTGLDERKTLISSEQVPAWYEGDPVREELHKRGVRGAYLVSTGFELGAGAGRRWRIVCDADRDQAGVVELRSRLADSAALDSQITASVKDDSRRLSRIMASADGFQSTSDEVGDSHHYSNVMFNVLRGGIADDQYRISSEDLCRTIDHYNHALFVKHAGELSSLAQRIDRRELLARIEQDGDPQLLRLALEYLPITFGRRHGDPSRPWNRFEIKLLDDYGKPLLSYEGNWRDIFQNWEALALSYPAFIASFIARFVNASTADGYNPYRITKQGIDWEIEDPDDEWSFIGYWGDHQIIYLLKFLELSVAYNTGELSAMLRRRLFSYANVPYRIKPIDAILEDAKHTIEYDADLEREIQRRVASMGADGKLLLDSDDQVLMVNLMEKLLVPLLAKLSNLVIGGGIWLNTQRPEWNDANNAIVGQGLSMVTMCYLRRYITFLRDLLQEEQDTFSISSEVCAWLGDVAAVFAGMRERIDSGDVDDGLRYSSLVSLGEAASRYRDRLYSQQGFSGQQELAVETIDSMLQHALAAVDFSIGVNLREDGLYQAYNMLRLDEGQAAVNELYPMLEGQVAVLSSRRLQASRVVSVLDALFASAMYRQDQRTFMLYPDRSLPGFLARNRVSEELVENVPLLMHMLEQGDSSVILRDAEGQYRFNADLENVAELDARLDHLRDNYGDDIERYRTDVRNVYESVFNHRAFTGRSGTMFGFEGLGCIYWHMVSKLLLAVQECFFDALQQEPGAADAIGERYYRVREGLGFNKTPTEFGAFPMDAYSHTPGHAGAQQPGMTGQVKEELLTRSGELGIRVAAGALGFRPALLRSCEFIAELSQFRYLDVAGAWQELELPAGSLAFTLCQVPVIFTMTNQDTISLQLGLSDGSEQRIEGGELSAELSGSLFARDGRIERIDVRIGRVHLFD